MNKNKHVWIRFPLQSRYNLIMDSLGIVIETQEREMGYVLPFESKDQVLSDCNGEVLEIRAWGRLTGILKKNEENAAECQDTFANWVCGMLNSKSQDQIPVEQESFTKFVCEQINLNQHKIP